MHEKAHTNYISAEKSAMVLHGQLQHESHNDMCRDVSHREGCMLRHIHPV